MICDPCGIQTFIRGKRGIKLLAEFLENRKEIVRGNHLEIAALADRLSKLKAHLQEIENDNWLRRLGGDEPDAVRDAIKNEIRKIEAQLRETARD